MDTNEKLKLMAELKRSVIDYLQDELKINSDALKAYDDLNNPLQTADPEIKRLREFEAIKLRDRIHELNRHIAVVKRMYPDA
jgi:hypothetical protein